MTIETILPVEIGKSHVHYAQGVKAGRWVFATGHMATDFQNGLSPSVLNPGLPQYGRPKAEREADFIFERLKATLKAGNTDLSNIVRIDQYYPTWKAVDHYHVARRAAFGKYVPPSTSILEKGLLIPDAEIDVQIMAIIPEGDFCIQSLSPDDVSAPAESGYTSVVKAGDYVFVAGQLARGEDGDMAKEACVPANHRWKGTQIKLETDYIIRRRLKPALKAAGSSLANLIKSQIYLTDVNDTSGFNRVWGHYLSDDGPVTTIVPTAKPGLGTVGATVEINALALVDNGKTKKEVIDTDVFCGFERQTVAIRAGDLLFISGLMAVDRNGLVSEAKPDPRQPYFASSIQAQLRTILGKAERICNYAGTTLENVVRVQQFHTDLREFFPSYQVWQENLPGRFLPFSAVEVPRPLSAPGCTVLLDLWVYIG